MPPLLSGILIIRFFKVFDKMSLLKLIQERYSVRNYSTKEVEREKLEYILECARLAPSACNFQPWRFYIIQDANVQSEVLRSYDRAWMYDAPIYIVVTKNTEESWKRKDGKDSGDIDAAIVAEHICLAAADCGLGTCWVCNFDLGILMKALNIPSEEEAIALFPIGYEAEDKNVKPAKKRKTLDEITRWI